MIVGVYLLTSVELADVPFLFVFFFNDTATTEIYTLSLHDALPILCDGRLVVALEGGYDLNALAHHLRAVRQRVEDRKSTRLNSSHQIISYAVFCLKKKNRITLCLLRL